MVFSFLPKSTETSLAKGGGLKRPSSIFEAGPPSTYSIAGRMVLFLHMKMLELKHGRIIAGAMGLRG